MVKDSIKEKDKSLNKKLELIQDNEREIRKLKNEIEDSSQKSKEQSEVVKSLKVENGDLSQKLKRLQDAQNSNEESFSQGQSENEKKIQD